MPLHACLQLCFACGSFSQQLHTDCQANTLVAEVNATLEQVNAEINRTLGKQRADAERRLDEAQAKALGEVAALAAALRRQGVKV